ncbi:MAG: sn-glycerol-1-phosphate dehydrogenase [Saccharofermentanales bacterium]
MKNEEMPSLGRWSGWTASEIADDLMGKSFVCPSCGRTHAMTTKKLVLEEDLVDRMGNQIRSLGFEGSCLVVFDRNTYAAAGDRLMASLEGFRATKLVLDREDLHADADSIGRVVVAMSADPDLLVACGSGCITDTVRYAALKTVKPFVVFGTAASMDGYASGSTPLIVDGYKITYPGKAPVGIFADTKILAQAPRAMTAAGFGDVLAKIIAVIDWKLAYEVEGEPFCPLICDLVQKAADECISLADELAGGDPAACGKLMQVLALTGIAMQMMGTTRPASGGEHQISHLLEMRDIQSHKKGSLHGDKVGVATLITLYIYKRLFEGDRFPVQRETLAADEWEREVRRVYGVLADKSIAINPSTPPMGEEWAGQKKIIEHAMTAYGFGFIHRYCSRIGDFRQMIEKMGGPSRPDQLGYSVQEVYDAIAHAKEVRPKFSILRIAERYGYLYDFAHEIAEGLPEGKIY